jgi:molybdopterin-guanine dinucleotide biosynthesis protein A
MGRDKAGVTVGGVRLLERVLGTLRRLFREVFVVGGRHAHAAQRRRDVAVVPDPGDAGGLGPLAGIVAALRHTRRPACLVVACDMPFLSGRLIRHMVRLASAPGGADVVVPKDRSGYHPLHAVYRRRTVLPVLEARLAARRLAVHDAFGDLRCITVGEADLARLAGPGPDPLANVNTPAELARARRQARSRPRGPSRRVLARRTGLKPRRRARPS